MKKDKKEKVKLEYNYQNLKQIVDHFTQAGIPLENVTIDSSHDYSGCYYENDTPGITIIFEEI